MLFDCFSRCIGLRVSVLLGIKGEGENVVQARQTVDRCLRAVKLNEINKDK